MSAIPVPTSDRPSLAIDRCYDAAPEQVWRAWTDPQALTAWFAPGPGDTVALAETDVRVGGRFRIVMATAGGESHDVSGTYREVEPHRRLVFTWAWRSTPERESLVSIVFEPDGGGTLMRFRHEQFFDEAARDRHEHGWTQIFAKLAGYLAPAHA